MARFQYFDRELILCECDEGALVFNESKGTTTVINQQCLYVLRGLLQNPSNNVGQLLEDAGIDSDNRASALTFFLDTGLVHAKCD